MANHKCRKSGDHIARIASEHAHYDWKTIWDKNELLQSSRSRCNPLVLFVGDRRRDGDVLELPDKAGTKPVGTDAHVVLQVPKPKAVCLRLRVLKADFTPVTAESSFELKVDGTHDGKTWEYKGKTDAEGFLVVEKDGAKVPPEIPPAAMSATLSLSIKAEDTEAGTPGGGPAGGGAPGGGAEVSDADADGGLAGTVPLSWKLEIGRLNPIMEKAPTLRCISGVQARLNNLGFNCGPVDGLTGPNTREGVERFQAMFDLAVDGIPGQGETQPEIKKVYDLGEFKGPPTPNDKAVKHPCPEKKKLKTTDKDIGHVGLSFVDPPHFVDGSKPFINTFVIRPEYRIKLRLGSIQDLFMHAPRADEGRMERMQVAGLFYFPLNHTKAEDAFKETFKWYTAKVMVGTDIDADLDRRLNEWVVDGGTLPEPVEEGGDAKKDAAKHYRKIRLPGGYTYIDGAGDFKPNKDDKYPMRLGQEDVHDAEKQAFTDNSVLGSIPLIATLELRNSESGEWKPAKDEEVYFKLIKPYDLPAFDAATSPAAQINRPPLRESNMQLVAKGGAASGKGPNKLDVAASAHLPDATGKDPQVDNCHKARGGHRGDPVAGHVFEIDATYGNVQTGASDAKPRLGFHAEHTDVARKDLVKGPFFPQPEAATGAKHEHAVKAGTNENGEAGVIFRPSRTGGDRYRLVVYHGAQSDGTGIDAVAVETGTFVVWRNVRVSQTLQMPVSTMSLHVRQQIVKTALGLFQKMKHIFANQNATLGEAQHYLGFSKHDGTFVGYSDIGRALTGHGTIAYDGYIEGMAQAFCEVELEAGAAAATTVTEADWRRSLKAAIKFAKANNTVNVDVDELIVDDPKKAKVSDSFVMIPLNSVAHYNKSLKKGSPKKIKDRASWTDPEIDKFDTWFDQCILYPFVHELTGHGYLTGLSIVQMPTISSWHIVGTLGDYSIGLGFRVTVMSGGKDLFPTTPMQQPAGKVKRLKRKVKDTVFPEFVGMKFQGDYSYGGLLLHELGHCLFRRHAPPDPVEPTDTSYAALSKQHDPEPNGYCVMTYLTCEGQYCAKCLLGLRGWSDLANI